MNAEDRTDKVDVKGLLGNPKITFVTGAPGSGKGSQCAKLVEEFGYTHISTGDLMRAEMKKGSRDGDRIRQIVDQGKLVPLELTVQVLINALIANPSQSYLVDGFPRSVEQATYFETNVCEAQTCLFFDCDEETCIKRLIKRQAIEGRSDDNAETITKRFQAYNESSAPVKDFYSRFGKIRAIDGGRDPLEVYEETRKAMLPQISCIIGPKASGKTHLSDALCERTNMKHIHFGTFVEENKLQDCDDETITTALIKCLSREPCPRVLLEDFPQSEYQAKFFIKNCVTPSRVFVLQCSKDTCQERMLEKGQNAPGYCSSAILSKKIRYYNENCSKLLPYLSTATNLKTLNTETIFDISFKTLCSFVEPSILIVRSSGFMEAQELSKNIITGLIKNQGYQELNVPSLIKDESDRHTEIGKQIVELVSTGQTITNTLIVRMLIKNIYSGIEGRDKFILTDFPETREQAQDFEAKCSKIQAVLFAAGQEEQVELADNALAEDSIEAYFQKDNRLKTIKAWKDDDFKEQLGNKTDWAIIRGDSLTGKTGVANMIATATKGKVLNLNTIAEAIRPRLETEDGPFEGRVPDEEVEKDIKKLVETDKACGNKFFYLIDGMYHESLEQSLEFLCGCFGSPSHLITTTASPTELELRLKEQKEMGAGDELGEDDQAELKEKAAAAVKDLEKYKQILCQDGKVCQIEFDTGNSRETLAAEIRQAFCAKVIIVNHGKRLDVDVVCSNLAIKYNMLYLSVYQLIKKEIECNTKMGKDLWMTRRTKDLTLDGEGEDQWCEEKYSAVHFDQTLVIRLVQQKIAENRTNQKYILLEGLCNSSKLTNPENRLELRFMDEFFAIEQNIGEVSAVIDLANQEEQTQFIVGEDEIEHPVEEEVKEEKPAPVEGEEEEEQQEAAGEDGEPKVAAWKPTDFTWTVTNGRPRNLPQLCREYMGNRFNPDVKNWKNYQVATHAEAVVCALDELCSRLSGEAANAMIYQQVIFCDEE